MNRNKFKDTQLWGMEEMNIFKATIFIQHLNKVKDLHTEKNMIETNSTLSRIIYLHTL